MCWGRNTKLNCLEYHRDSEVNIGASDFILLLAKQEERPIQAPCPASLESGCASSHLFFAHRRSSSMFSGVMSGLASLVPLGSATATRYGKHSSAGGGHGL